MEASGEGRREARKRRDERTRECARREVGLRANKRAPFRGRERPEEAVRVTKETRRARVIALLMASLSLPFWDNLCGPRGGQQNERSQHES